MELVIGIVVGLVAGAALVYGALIMLSGSRLAAARRTRQLLVAEARREAEALRREAQIEAREEGDTLRSEVESEVQGPRAELVHAEERAAAKEEDFDRRA